MQADSSTNLRPILIPPHALQRLSERGANLDVVYALLKIAQKSGPPSGYRVLDECDPVLVVEFRSRRIILKTALERGMALKPGTQILHA